MNYLPFSSHIFLPLHLNIRSLNHHFANLCTLLDSTPLRLTLLDVRSLGSLPQSYLDCFTIPGYVFIKDNRTYSSGGGVDLYIKSDYSFHLRDYLRIDIIENVWIETKDLIIGVIYKPPSLSNRDFLHDKLF